MKRLILLEIIKENFPDISINNIGRVEIAEERAGIQFKIRINDEKEVTKRNGGIIETIDYTGIGQLKYLTDLEVRLFEEHLNAEEIAELKELQSLRIDGHDLRDISFLKDLKELEKLWIPKKRENDVLIDISVLGELHKLTSLQIRCLQVVGSECLNELRNLEFLGIMDIGINNLKCIEQLKKLKVLQLDYNKELNDLTGLEQLPSLQIVGLNEIGTKAKFDEVGKLINLLELNLSCNKSFIDIQLLKDLKKLEKLTLDLSKVKNFEYIRELSALKELRLETVKTIKDFTAIGELSHLETLILRKNKQLTDISFLAPLKKLKHLEVYECGKIEDYSAVEHVEKVVK